MNKITFFSKILQQTLRRYETLAIISQIWQSQILFYMHQHPIVLGHGTQYQKEIHPPIMEECTRKDWQMDWWTDGLMHRQMMDWTLFYITWFHLGGVGNNNVLIKLVVWFFHKDYFQSPENHTVISVCISLDMKIPLHGHGGAACNNNMFYLPQ